MAGTGSCSASSGSQMVAASLVPSARVIHSVSIARTRRGKSVLTDVDMWRGFPGGVLQDRRKQTERNPSASDPTQGNGSSARTAFWNGVPKHEEGCRSAFLVNQWRAS